MISDSAKSNVFDWSHAEVASRVQYEADAVTIKVEFFREPDNRRRRVDPGNFVEVSGERVRKPSDSAPEVERLSHAWLDVQLL